jgi:hypothetical protein
MKAMKMMQPNLQMQKSISFSASLIELRQCSVVGWIVPLTQRGGHT